MPADKKQILMQSIEKLLALKVSDEEIVKELVAVGLREDDAKSFLKQAKESYTGMSRLDQRKLKRGGGPEEIVLPSKESEETKKEVGEEKVKKLEEELKKGREKKEENTAFKKSSGAKTEDFKKSSGAKTEDFKKSSGAKAEKPETKKKEKPVKEKKVKKLAPIKKSDVWEQGILTTINQKIEEIEDVQRELDEVIDSKVQKHLEEEKKKMNTLIESQYSLLYEKINSVLDEKVNELNNALEEKTEKFNKLSKSVASGIAKQAEEKASYEQLLEEIEKRIEDLPDLKKRLVSKVEEETEQMKNSSKKFIEEAEEGMNEMDERINKALELETKIIEGLVKDTEERIQEMAEKRSNFLSGELKVKLDELTELKKSLTPGFVQEKTKELSVKMEAKMQEMISLKEREIDEAIEIKTKELDSLKQKMAGAEQLTKAAAEIEKLSSFKEDLQNQLNQSKQEIENLKGELKKFIGAQLIEASSETEEKINELFERRKDELALFQKKSQGIDVDKFEQKMQELDSFKEQFTEIIQKNISSIKRTREEMISELDTKGSLIDGKINQINSKMEELSAFEKNFAREMGLAVEKLIEKKKIIKPSLPKVKPKPASKKKEERDDYIRKAFKERIRKAKKGR